VYGVNLEAKFAHGKELSVQMGATAQRSRYIRDEVWTEVDGVQLTTRRMPRTPDFYGYLTLTTSPFKNFEASLSGTYTGEMIVPHYAGYIEKDRMENTPDFFDVNMKLAYTFLLRDHIKLQVNTGVQNIFDNFQKDLDKGEFRDSGYFYGPTQPRTFFVGVNIMN
jgi:outer membrane receptor for ferrienterochelin and colicins